MSDEIKALPMDTAPKDNTLVRLLVDYSGEGEHPLEDAVQAWTIGFNNFEDSDIDEWQFAGWSWSQDCFCEGQGRVVGWAPFHQDEADWRDDPAQDERWNAGVDFVMTQLCKVLKVDPETVTWDAATETLDGDVQAVLCNIMRGHFGEDWGASSPSPAPREVGSK